MPSGGDSDRRAIAPSGLASLPLREPLEGRWATFWTNSVPQMGDSTKFARLLPSLARDDVLRVGDRRTTTKMGFDGLFCSPFHAHKGATGSVDAGRGAVGRRSTTYVLDIPMTVVRQRWRRRWGAALHPTPTP